MAGLQGQTNPRGLHQKIAERAALLFAKLQKKPLAGLGPLGVRWGRDCSFTPLQVLGGGEGNGGGVVPSHLGCCLPTPAPGLRAAGSTGTLRGDLLPQPGLQPQQAGLPGGWWWGERGHSNIYISSNI